MIVFVVKNIKIKRFFKMEDLHLLCKMSEMKI